MQPIHPLIAISPRHHEDMVYFARDPGTGRVKIGHTHYLQNRLRTLGRIVGRDLELLAVASGGFRLEHGFHDLIGDLHEGGEWFRPDPRLDALVIALREGWLDCDEIARRRHYTPRLARAA